MPVTLETVILECRDMEELVSFYSSFLGWPVVYRDPEFTRLQSTDSPTGIAVQYAADYLPPVWPSAPGKQQMMAHLDFGVDREHLRETLDKVLGLGARIAPAQYGGDEWITLLDPAGHPFCLLIWDEREMTPHEPAI